MSMIYDEAVLREMRKNTDKSKRVNSYKFKYMKFDGTYEELRFNQGYDASTDVYNPFFIRVYDSNGSYVHGGTSSTIAGAYNGLVSSLILYLIEAKTKRDESNMKLAQIIGIIRPNSEDEDYND